MVVNAAAYNQVDLAETEPLTAFQVKRLAVRNLAVACRNSVARLVHFSTDYVSTARRAARIAKTMRPGPLGRTRFPKLAGELYARAYLDRAVDHPDVARFSDQAGWIQHEAISWSFMLRLAAENKPIRVVEDHVASPTYAPALRREADLVERDAHGIFHWRRHTHLMVRLGAQDF